MKFKIIGWHELHFKKVYWGMALLLTIGSVILSIFSDEKSLILALVSIGYALFLFILSTYKADISSRSQNLFRRTKEQYIHLKNLANQVYKPTNWETNNLFLHLIVTKRLTGRIDEGNEDIKPFIKMEGVYYTEKYLQNEKLYLDLHSKLNTLDNKIKEYIADYNLKKRTLNVRIFEATEFFSNKEGWIDKNLDLNAEQRADILAFADNLYKENQKSFKAYSRAEKKIRRAIKKISDKCQKNILQIEAMYGEMLFQALDEESTLYTNFNVLEKMLRKIDLEKLDFADFIETSQEHFYDNKEDKIQMIKLIRNDIEELKEDFYTNFEQ